MNFTPNQILELMEIINFHHTLFIFNHSGSEILTDEDKKLLLKNGININSKSFIPTINKAFKFGVLAEALGNKNASTLNFTDFKDYIKRGKYIPLTKLEEYALENVKRQTYKDIKGLGNKISSDLNQVYIEVDKDLRAKREGIIRTTSTEVIQNREGIKKLVSKLGERLGDWNRDLGRVADCILHEAYEEGRAASLEEKYKGTGKEPLVYKDTFTGGCKWCIKLHLTDGIGSEPIIFKLSTLRANGSNIGRKPQDWKPIIGFNHPFCRCTMQEYDVRYAWNPSTNSFSTLKPYVQKYKSEGSIKIQIGDKTFNV